MNKLIILTTLVAAVLAQQPNYPKPAASAPSYSAPTAAPSYSAPAAAPSYSAPAAAPAYSKQEEQPPMPYSFNWAVKDEPSKNDYAHDEKSDGKLVTGSYRVALPDGRTQIVTYKADENGYVADVKYEGEAKYPEPSQYKPTAADKPAY